jgi:D-glycero-D-manno-heptose 1,7-bisphosphate phosphatase
MRPAVFIERDGILNLAQVERSHQITPLTVGEFRINNDALELLCGLKAAGLVLIATTNQPGLSRGYQSRWELDRMHGILKQRFPLDAILVCPHDENDNCPCRKPKPGLLLEAAFRWQLDLDRSFVISDKWQDAETARVAGCTSLLLRSPWIGRGHHDFILDSLRGMVDKIAQCAARPPQPVFSYEAVSQVP